MESEFQLSGTDYRKTCCDQTILMLWIFRQGPSVFFALHRTKYLLAILNLRTTKPTKRPLTNHGKHHPRWQQLLFLLSLESPGDRNNVITTKSEPNFYSETYRMLSQVIECKKERRQLYHDQQKRRYTNCSTYILFIGSSVHNTWCQWKNTFSSSSDNLLSSRFSLSVIRVNKSFSFSSKSSLWKTPFLINFLLASITSSNMAKNLLICWCKCLLLGSSHKRFFSKKGKAKNLRSRRPSLISL